mgnify:CR=1 FL=1
MADNRKRASRGGKQTASGSRPTRRNDRAAAPKGQRERSQAARPQRERSRDNVQVPKGEFIEGRRAAAEALRTGFPVKCVLIAEGGENIADSLRQNHKAHGLSAAEANAPGGLHLSAVHSLNTGADDLRHIGAAVHAHSHDTGGEPSRRAKRS